MNLAPGRPARRLAGVAGLLLLAPLAACTGGDGSPDSSATAPSAAPGEGVVLQPAEPGDPAATVGPDAEVPQAAWNHADLAFVQMMIPHHGQALEMSDLAEERAGDPRVRGLAERIAAAQLPEIRSMAAWLADRDMEVPRADGDPMDFDHGSHGHDGMAGMLTAEQMDALAAASGEDFDRLFLEGMIGHHEGALEMAANVATTGEDILVSELAADVSATQAAEIARMEGILADL